MTERLKCRYRVVSVAGDGYAILQNLLGQHVYMAYQGQHASKTVTSGKHLMGIVTVELEEKNVEPPAEWQGVSVWDDDV